MANLAPRVEDTARTGREGLLRDYAAGRVSWRELQEKGFDDFIQVLAGLGELGLRYPVAPMDGPNREARERGRAWLREALRTAFLDPVSIR